MAVSTNLGLYLPTRDDYISVQRDLSSNYEIIDEHAGMMENGIAIVINGDTAPKAITAGQYLFIKNHSTLATGGYHATANIALGATISNSNVAADADGIANALNAKFAPTAYTSPTMSAGMTLTSGGYIQIGKFVFVSMRINVTTSGNEICYNMPTPLADASIAASGAVSSFSIYPAGKAAYIQKNGIIRANEALPTGTALINGFYIAQ